MKPERGLSLHNFSNDKYELFKTFLFYDIPIDIITYGFPDVLEGVRRRSAPISIIHEARISRLGFWFLCGQTKVVD